MSCDAIACPGVQMVEGVTLPAAGRARSPAGGAALYDPAANRRTQAGKPGMLVNGYRTAVYARVPLWRALWRQARG